jgi:hypothetical protein
MVISVGYWRFVVPMLLCPTKISQNIHARSSTGGSKMLDTILIILGLFGILAFIGVILTVLLDNPDDY